eukprot:9351974-Pyramimonas_sp.AAC.1
MEGGFLSKCVSCFSAAHMCFQSSQKFQGNAWETSQKRHLGKLSDCQSAAVTLVRGVEVPGMVFWHGAGSQDTTVILTRGVKS